MAARLGIELSPSACRVIELDGPPLRRRDPHIWRVRAFAVLPPSGEVTRAKLASLAGRKAAVVVWNASVEHRQVVVTGGTYESMRAEALASLAFGGLQSHAVVADIVPVAGKSRRGLRQPVVVALARAPGLAAALQPVREAGIQLRSVTTPAVALASLARQRRASSVPGAIEAYVALEQSVACIALVRDAVLVAARNLPWGYADARSGLARSRDYIASQVADGVEQFVAAIGEEPRDLGQVCVCGGVPELRSMTLPLMERLDVEVEPLDSLFGIDVAQLPAPADEFRERSAEMRLAWAAAADWPPPINLLRAQQRAASRTMLTRAAVAAGVVAGVAAGWRVEQSQWWRSRPAKPATSADASATTRGRTGTPSPPPRAAAPSETRNAPPVMPRPDAGPRLPTVAIAPAIPPPAAAAPGGATNMPPPTAMPSRPVFMPAAVGPRLPAAAAVAPMKESKQTPAGPAGQPGKAPVVPVPPALQAQPQRAAAAAPPRIAATPAPTTVSSSATPGPQSRGAPPSLPREPSLSVSRDVPRVVAPPRTEAPARQVPPPAIRTEPSATRVQPPAIRTEPPPTGAPPAVRTESPAARTQAPAVRGEPAPPQVEATATRAVERPAVNAMATPTPTTQSTAPGVSAAARLRPAPREVALPFDATLGTILYSPDRKLAIVDGRIVGIGDQVRDSRIVDITPSAVLLRDGRGRLRQLTMGATGR